MRGSSPESLGKDVVPSTTADKVRQMIYGPNAAAVASIFASAKQSTRDLARQLQPDSAVASNCEKRHFETVPKPVVDSEQQKVPRNFQLQDPSVLQRGKSFGVQDLEDLYCDDDLNANDPNMQLSFGSEENARHAALLRYPTHGFLIDRGMPQ